MQINRMIHKILTYVKKKTPYDLKYKILRMRYKVFNMFSCVSIETATVCNRRCSYCPNSIYDRGLPENEKKMDTKLFYKIIDELAALRWLGQIQPSYYNEPLLDERLPELLAYAKSKLPLCLFRVITNGDLLTVDMYKKLVKDGVNEFVVSQHQKEETKTISTLKEYRENHGADGVNVIYKTLGSITSRGGLVEVKGNWSLQEKCTYPLWNVIVDYSGELVFCCEDYLSTVKLGNVNSGTLMQIWNSAYYRKLRKEIDQGIFNVEICNKCVGGRNPASA